MEDHFHSTTKGCEIEDRVKVKKPENNWKYNLPHKFCKTHNVEICRCGYEWGWHFNNHIGKYTMEVYGNKLLYQR